MFFLALPLPHGSYMYWLITTVQRFFPRNPVPAYTFLAWLLIPPLPTFLSDFVSFLPSFSFSYFFISALSYPFILFCSPHLSLSVYQHMCISEYLFLSTLLPLFPPIIHLPPTPSHYRLSPSPASITRAAFALPGHIALLGAFHPSYTFRSVYFFNFISIFWRIECTILRPCKSSGHQFILSWIHFISLYIWQKLCLPSV